MIPKIKDIIANTDFTLNVTFDDGKSVSYDVMEDINEIPSYSLLKEDHNLFQQVQLDESRTCVYWNDEIDLPSDIIYEYGKDLSKKG